MLARKYHYLIALAREKHFGRAAAACHISPSTLSAAIRDLEAELDVTIVERGQQFSGLTSEGQCVLKYAQHMADSEEGLRQELARQKTGLTGTLRLGVIPTALTKVAEFSAAFATAHPLVRIQVLSLSTDEIIHKLQHFDLEAGIVYRESGDSPQLKSQPLWQEDHVFVTCEGQSLAQRPSISWQEAAQVPLVLLTKDMQNRKITDQVFHKLGCDPQPTLETNSIISILAHIRTGLWSCILPKGILEQIGLPKGLCRIPLTEPVLSWNTCLITQKRQSCPPLIAALHQVALSLPPLAPSSDT